MGAIGGLRPDTLLPLLPNILKLSSQLSEVKELTSLQINTQVMLSTLVFQTLSNYQWNNETITMIHKAIGGNNLWANYRIARAAVRYGHHNIALDIFKGLTEQVSSENLHFWLVCLKEMCEAESQLVNDSKKNLVDQLDSAVTHYNKAIAALKV